ncbi:type II toxin-antitoxin system death-on-curing family toxin [Paenibacillus thiaminolyticus]|uniref:Type II toxin-antitoxin system death-on-curing family toxin n=1 Tax=Paenibacillus thiaminolyticus TaxID=49283 RepID=A0AAP9DVN6_PANTH|nr:type II toxin-antitoxin system death-on-curing family toxin [Paenibacillus thiaminolyticus]MCY9538989.1 type II toxin-antitoxin system death-on-curing family toxin [Paenibacillus thiaminolyticus]MCY9604225.1 type II toxin-antitoxin system death-on-curing family toxin [Paenibacillus thiaminolyticus]MCY9608100.1 type II toxin-antitoxin system death-on-curing family toxin [Paenibacillus thiaminolyticus]MCY9612939.1 type II toxin-antitoxin system death-on-curing family toxin [Paenibacillus thiam
MNQVKYLSVKEVIAINVAMIQRYSPSEQIGVKDPALLEFAVFRAESSAFGADAYPSIFEKTVALFQSLGQNHPFHNANKRTAFTALVIFLRHNHLHFKMDPQLAENLTVDMVNHKYPFEDLVAIVEEHCVVLHK